VAGSVLVSWMKLAASNCCDFALHYCITLHCCIALYCIIALHCIKCLLLLARLGLVQDVMFKATEGTFFGICLLCGLRKWAGISRQ